MTGLIAAEGLHAKTICCVCAASVERASEHPLALAIVAAADEQEACGRGCDGVRFSDRQGRARQGRGTAGGAWQCDVPRENTASTPRRSASQADESAEERRDRDLRGRRRKVAGVIAIADPVKASTPEALAALKAEGLRIVMLTGDNWTTAKAVARQLGIDDVAAEVLPEQKSDVVNRYKAEGRDRCDGG